MLSLYSVPACKPWGRPENTKGTMGEAPEVQGPAALHSLRTGWTTEAFHSWVEKRLDHSQCAKAHTIEAYIIFIRTFSFPDARKAHNRLRWIGKTRKMAGTSGNTFNGSYRVQLDHSHQVWRSRSALAVLKSVVLELSLTSNPTTTTESSRKCLENLTSQTAAKWQAWGSRMGRVCRITTDRTGSAQMFAVK